jgi:hypothetical protein
MEAHQEVSTCDTKVKATSSTKTGFSHLPLELRQMVYSHLQPTDRIVESPNAQGHWWHTTMSALLRAHPDVRDETDAYIYKTCTARFTIMSGEDIDLPGTVELARFQRIELFMKMNQFMNPFMEFMQSWRALGQLVNILRKATPTELPEVRVHCYRPCEACVPQDDPKWDEGIWLPGTTAAPDHELIKISVRTSTSSPTRVVASILDPVLGCRIAGRLWLTLDPL